MNCQQNYELFMYPITYSCSALTYFRNIIDLFLQNGETIHTDYNIVDITFVCARNQQQLKKCCVLVRSLLLI